MELVEVQYVGKEGKRFSESAAERERAKQEGEASVMQLDTSQR